MSVRLAFSVDTSDMERRLEEGERRAADQSGVHRVIGEVLVTAIRRNMDTSGDGTWAPLKPGTLLHRAALGVGKANVLKKRGGLTKAAAQVIASAKPLILSPAGLYALISYQASAEAVEAGSNLRYAAHQFFGSKPGWRWNIPARNPLYLHDEDEREVQHMYEQWIGGPFQ